MASSWESVLGERDCISIPPGVYRGEINVGEEEAIMIVMIGSSKPVTPTYSGRPSALEGQARLTPRNSSHCEPQGAAIQSDR